MAIPKDQPYWWTQARTPLTCDILSHRVVSGKKLVRVSYAMMRGIVMDTIRDVTGNLDAIHLPGADVVLESITDVEDSAIGAGLLSMNKKLFDDHEHVSVLCQ